MSQPGTDSHGAARGDSLVSVQVASWRYGYAGIVPSDLLASLTGEEAQGVWRDRWREAITNPPTSRHRVLVAVSDTPAREVVGFVSAGPATDADRWPGTDGELYELRVAPDRTGQGHGGRLLHAAADTLAEASWQDMIDINLIEICGEYLGLGEDLGYWSAPDPPQNPNPPREFWAWCTAARLRITVLAGIGGWPPPGGVGRVT